MSKFLTDWICTSYRQNDSFKNDSKVRQNSSAKKILNPKVIEDESMCVGYKTDRGDVSNMNGHQNYSIQTNGAEF